MITEFTQKSINVLNFYIVYKFPYSNNTISVDVCVDVCFSVYAKQKTLHDRDQDGSLSLLLFYHSLQDGRDLCICAR